MSHLPAPLLFGQSQVPVDDVQEPFGCLQDGQLGTARFALFMTQRNLVVVP